MLFIDNYSTIILMYHSINTLACERIHTSNIVEPVNFEYQMAYLAANMNVISLDDYVCMVGKKRKPHKNSVVITFDDGYKDNFTNAYPILQKHKLPATFFLSTAFIGAGRTKWEDYLSCIIKRTTTRTFSLEHRLLNGKKVFDIESAEKKRKAIDKLVSLLVNMDVDNRALIIEQVQSQLTVENDSLEQDSLMLSWDDVRVMAQSENISFGAHGTTHTLLTTLSPENIRQEVNDAKEEIEDCINNTPVRYFSYPYGGLSEQVKGFVSDSGFDCAVTTTYGRNDVHTDLFQLNRIMAPNQRGLRFRIGIEIRSSPIGEALRKLLELYFETR